MRCQREQKRASQAGAVQVQRGGGENESSRFWRLRRDRGGTAGAEIFSMLGVQSQMAGPEVGPGLGAASSREL